MALPELQSILRPVLKMIADGLPVEQVREQLKHEFQITSSEAQKKYKKGQSTVYVNLVAWALAHLVMGRAIVRKGKGVYEVTDKGLEMLKSNPTELTIKDLH